MYFKREIKSSKIGTKFIPALKYGAFFGFSRKNYWNDLTNCHKFPLDPPKYGVNVIYTDTQFNGRL